MKRFWVVSDDFKRVESHDCPMSTCATPAGSNSAVCMPTIPHGRQRLSRVAHLPSAVRP